MACDQRCVNMRTRSSIHALQATSLRPATLPGLLAAPPTHAKRLAILRHRRQHHLPVRLQHRPRFPQIPAIPPHPGTLASTKAWSPLHSHAIRGICLHMSLRGPVTSWSRQNVIKRYVKTSDTTTFASRPAGVQPSTGSGVSNAEAQF